MFNIWQGMTRFDKAGTFLNCGQAVDLHSAYLFRKDLQSLVITSPALCVCSLHGQELFSGLVCYLKELNPTPKRNICFMETDMVWISMHGCVV